MDMFSCDVNTVCADAVSGDSPLGHFPFFGVSVLQKIDLGDGDVLDLQYFQMLRGALQLVSQKSQEELVKALDAFLGLLGALQMASHGPKRRASVVQHTGWSCVLLGALLQTRVQGIEGLCLRGFVETNLREIKVAAEGRRPSVIPRVLDGLSERELLTFVSREIGEAIQVQEFLNSALPNGTGFQGKAAEFMAKILALGVIVVECRSEMPTNLQHSSLKRLPVSKCCSIHLRRDAFGDGGV